MPLVLLYYTEKQAGFCWYVTCYSRDQDVIVNISLPSRAPRTSSAGFPYAKS